MKREPVSKTYKYTFERKKNLYNMVEFYTFAASGVVYMICGTQSS